MIFVPGMITAKLPVERFTIADRVYANQSQYQWRKSLAPLQGDSPFFDSPAGDIASLHPRLMAATPPGVSKSSYTKKSTSGRPEREVRCGANLPDGPEGPSYGVRIEPLRGLLLPAQLIQHLHTCNQPV